MRQSERAEQVNARLGVLIAQQHAIGAEIVECLAELHELEGWQGEGYRSMGHFLSVRGGYTMSEAKRYETVAIRLDNVRLIHADARDGRFSVGVVAMAARVATPENEETVAQIVRDTVPSQARGSSRSTATAARKMAVSSPTPTSTTGRSTGSMISAESATTLRSTPRRALSSRRRGKRPGPRARKSSTPPISNSAAASMPTRSPDASRRRCSTRRTAQA